MSRRRKIAVWVLVILASLIAVVSSLTIWTKRQLLNTDAWTNSASEILADSQVRNALANKLVDLLYQRVDVTAELKSQLPEAAQPVAPAIAAGLQTAAVRATDMLLGTPQAQQLWEQANRRAHTRLVAVLEGKSNKLVSSAGGTVTLDLRPLIAQIADRIGIDPNKLKERAPPNAGQIVLLKSDQLEAAQKTVRVLKVLSVFLAILVIVLYALAVWLARGRRRFFLSVTGISLVLVGLLLVVVRRVVGDAIVDSLVSTEANKAPVHTVWLIETRLLGDIGVALIAYGVLAILAAWLGGTSRPATAIRRFLAPSFRDYPVLVYAVAAVLFLIVLGWGPTGASRQLIGILILGALFFGGIEIWRRQTLREFPDAGGAGEGDAGPPAKPPEPPAMTPPAEPPPAPAA